MARSPGSVLTRRRLARVPAIAEEIGKLFAHLNEQRDFGYASFLKAYFKNGGSGTPDNFNQLSATLKLIGDYQSYLYSQGFGSLLKAYFELDGSGTVDDFKTFAAKNDFTELVNK